MQVSVCDLHTQNNGADKRPKAVVRTQKDPEKCLGKDREDWD